MFARVLVALALALLPFAVRAMETPSLDALRRFPGTVLVPPEGLTPFAHVPLVRAEAYEAGSPITALDEPMYVAVWDDGQAFDKYTSIQGTRGSGPLALAAREDASCLPQPDYCPIAPIGGEGEPVGEVFLSLSIRGAPARISRLACCNGGGWFARWYDASADVTYDLALPLSAAYPHASPAGRGYGSSPENIRGARQVVGIAEQLVRLH
jgi:hypothetical protein